MIARESCPATMKLVTFSLAADNREELRQFLDAHFERVLGLRQICSWAEVMP